MKALGILTIIWISIFAFILLIFHIKSRKPFKSIFINAFIAFVALAIINLTRKYTDVTIPINWYTLTGSGVFGIPFICGLILFQIFI